MPSTPDLADRSSRDPALDGLRGLAVLLVFLFHYGGGLRSTNPLLRCGGYLTEAGWIGVELFFALSGYLITRQLARMLLRPDARKPPGSAGHTPLTSFYARRALRILPLYVLALAVAATAALHAGAHPAALRPLLIYLAFLQNLPTLIPFALRAPPPVPLHHLWSLAVEEQFYLLWPAGLLWARTRQRAFVLSLTIFSGSLLFRDLIFAPGVMSLSRAITWSTLLPSRAGALGLGAALALQNDRSRTAVRLFWWTLWLSLGGFAVVGLLTGTLLLNNRLGYIAALPLVDGAAAAAVGLSLSSSVLRRGLVRAGMPFLGRISYGFYVFHLLLQPVVDHVVVSTLGVHHGAFYQTARLLFAFPLTLAVAWLSFVLWEAPFLRLKSRFAQAGPWLSQAPAADLEPPLAGNGH